MTGAGPDRPGADGGPNRSAVDPRTEEARDLAALTRIGATIVAGVERRAAGYLRAAVGRLLDAWGGLDPEARRSVEADVAAAAVAASDRVAGELAGLLATDPAEQRATPLEVVRSLVREPTAVLRSARVPELRRDMFAVRALPDDVYGLAPHTFADLGEEDLGPQHLAWGMAKAGVLRARAGRAAPPDGRSGS